MHRGRFLLFFASASASTWVVLACITARNGHTEETPPTAVSVDVVGHGTIRLIVADGATRPCESSDNRILYSDRAEAGDTLKLTSATGSVCVDHTYGAFRDSQWAGAAIWSGSSTPWSRPSAIHGAVSTERP